MIGKILPEDKLYLRERVGTVNVGGNDYEMQQIVQNRTPIIENMKTGKKFNLSWEDIFSLALEAGINKE